MLRLCSVGSLVRMLGPLIGRRRGALIAPRCLVVRRTLVLRSLPVVRRLTLVPLALRWRALMLGPLCRRAMLRRPLALLGLLLRLTLPL